VICESAIRRPGLVTAQLCVRRIYPLGTGAFQNLCCAAKAAVHAAAIKIRKLVARYSMNFAIDGHAPSAAVVQQHPNR
jgi:hypothetical protein